MAWELHGRLSWTPARRDAEGHREFEVVHRIKSTNKEDGPAAAMETPGLPEPGSPWAFGNDSDAWAFCTEEMEITPAKELTQGQDYRYFDVKQKFSSKPPPKDQQRCNDQSIQDPLLEPAKVSGNFVTFQEEAMWDRWGFPILSSSFERLSGPQIEFDRSRPTLRIEQNVPVLNLALLVRFQDCVNAFPIWGCDRRCVKLSKISWERQYYGNCYSYYKRTLEFDFNFETFDRLVLDEGTKALNGRFNSNGDYVLEEIGGSLPNPANPQHFSRFKDRKGENCRVVLNGRGLPAGVRVSYPVTAAQLTATNNVLLHWIDVQALTDATDNVWFAFQSPPAFEAARDSYNTMVTLLNAVVRAGPRATQLSWIASRASRLFEQASRSANLAVAVDSNTDLDEGTALYMRATTDYSNAAASLSDFIDLIYAGTGTGMGFVADLEETFVGSIFVSKYLEADFSVLGVPLTF